MVGGNFSIARVSVKASEWDLLSYDKVYMPAIILRDFDFRWYLPKLKISDLILNFLCFLPFGFSLAMATRHPKSIVAGIVCSLISLGVEFIQLFFSFRIPSISDLLTNTASGFLGAFFQVYGQQRGIAQAPLKTKHCL